MRGISTLFVAFVLFTTCLDSYCYGLKILNPKEDDLIMAHPPPPPESENNNNKKYQKNNDDENNNNNNNNNFVENEENIASDESFAEFDIVFDLEGFEIPTMGVVSVFLDGKPISTLCPTHVDHIDDCPIHPPPPTQSKLVKIEKRRVISGLHSLVIQLIDFESLEVLEMKTISFFVQSEKGEFLPSPPPPPPLFNIIIFSKNRACQLDLLLRTLRENAPSCTVHRTRVLYTSTDDDYSEGYRRLKRVHPDFTFVLQNETGATFKEALLNTLDPSLPYTMFFVDDQVVTAPFDFENDAPFKIFASDPKIMTLSLRMHPNINYCYPSDQSVSAPLLTSNLTWSWRGSEGDWGYPMSVDAHIFRTKEIVPLLNRLSYSNPNELEAKMHHNPLPNPLMICYPTPRVFNIPTNRVQDTFNNRHMLKDRPIHKFNGFSPRGLNTEFLLGRRLSVETLRGLAPPSPHVAIPLVFGVGARPRTKTAEAKGEEIYTEDDPELQMLEMQERGESVELLE